MLNKIHEIAPGPSRSELPEYVRGMLAATLSGNVELATSALVGDWAFLAIRHTPEGGKLDRSGLYTVNFTITGAKKRKTRFTVFHEADTPWASQCCPAKVLKATKAHAVNAAFRSGCDTYNASKAAMANLKIGSIVFFERSVVATDSGQRIVIAEYANTDEWKRLAGSGPDRRLFTKPESLYRYGAAVIYPDMLEPVYPEAVTAGMTAVEGVYNGVGVYYEEVDGKYVLRGRFPTNLEIKERKALLLAQLTPQRAPASRNSRFLFM